MTRRAWLVLVGLALVLVAAVLLAVVGVLGEANASRIVLGVLALLAWELRRGGGKGGGGAGAALALLAGELGAQVFELPIAAAGR